MKVLMSVALVLTAGAALAETPPLPAAMQALVDYTRTSCETQGGTFSLGPDAILSADLNGDGAMDFIYDGAGVSCSANSNLMCSEVGCELNVVVGEDQHNFIVLGWSVEKIDDRIVLRTKQSGLLLNKPQDGTYDLVFDNTQKAWVEVK